MPQTEHSSPAEALLMWSQLEGLFYMVCRLQSNNTISLTLPQRHESSDLLLFMIHYVLVDPSLKDLCLIILCCSPVFVVDCS